MNNKSIFHVKMKMKTLSNNVFCLQERVIEEVRKDQGGVGADNGKSDEDVAAERQGDWSTAGGTLPAKVSKLNLLLFGC